MIFCSLTRKSPCEVSGTHRVMQAHHIDTDYYDRFFGAGAYGPAHAAHMATWHP